MMHEFTTIDRESDAELLTALFDEYYPIMKYTAMGIVHDEAEAEDAVQDAFVGCLRHVDTLRHLSPAARSVYLLTAAKRSALSLIRKKRRYADLPPEENTLQDDMRSVEETAIDNLTMEQVRNAFPKLPDSIKDVLRYKYLMGLNDREIAKLLGVKKGTVRVYLMRAKQVILSLTR